MGKDTWVWTFGSAPDGYFVELSKLTLFDEALMYVADWGVGNPLYRYQWYARWVDKLLVWLERDRREVAMRIPITREQAVQLGWPGDDD